MKKHGELKMFKKSKNQNHIEKWMKKLQSLMIIKLKNSNFVNVKALFSHTFLCNSRLFFVLKEWR